MRLTIARPGIQQKVTPGKLGTGGAAPFHSRETYLAWRAGWRARLRQYVEDRRAWRIPRWDRSMAHQLEQERAAAKVEAQRQYQAGKTVNAA